MPQTITHRFLREKRKRKVHNQVHDTSSGLVSGEIEKADTMASLQSPDVLTINLYSVVRGWRYSGDCIVTRYGLIFSGQPLF